MSADKVMSDNSTPNRDGKTRSDLAGACCIAARVQSDRLPDRWSGGRSNKHATLLERYQTIRYQSGNAISPVCLIRLGGGDVSDTSDAVFVKYHNKNNNKDFIDSVSLTSLTSPTPPSNKQNQSSVGGRPNGRPFLPLHIEPSVC